MTPQELTDARLTLGLRWGIKNRHGQQRGLTKTEMGRLLYLGEAMGYKKVNYWETASHRIPGTVAALLRLYLEGALPPDGIEIIARPGRDESVG